MVVQVQVLRALEYVGVERVPRVIAQGVLAQDDYDFGAYMVISPLGEHLSYSDSAELIIQAGGPYLRLTLFLLPLCRLS